MKTFWRTCSGIIIIFFLQRGGAGEGIGGIFKEICQKFLGCPGWLYNWSLPYKSPNVSSKIDSGRVDLQAILKSYQMVVDINLCQEFLPVFFLYLSPVTASV